MSGTTGRLIRMPSVRPSFPMDCFASRLRVPTPHPSSMNSGQRLLVLVRLVAVALTGARLRHESLHQVQYLPLLMWYLTTCAPWLVLGRHWLNGGTKLKIFVSPLLSIIYTKNLSLLRFILEIHRGLPHPLRTGFPPNPLRETS